MRYVNSTQIRVRLCQKRDLLKGAGAEDGLRQRTGLAIGNNILIVVANAESYHIICFKGLFDIPDIYM